MFENSEKTLFAIESLTLGRGGVDKVSQFIGEGKTILYNATHEIHSGHVPEWGCIRHPGGDGMRAWLSVPNGLTHSALSLSHISPIFLRTRMYSGYP